jgi:hypothetical protein
MAVDQEYFLIQKKDDDTLPSLTPDENTVDRHYSFEPQPYRAAPLMFLMALVNTPGSWASCLERTFLTFCSPAQIWSSESTYAIC